MKVYSFWEKFFQIQPEGRIRRRQYLVRMLSWGIVTALLATVVIYFANRVMLTSGGMNMFQVVVIDTGIWTIFGIPYLFLAYNLMVKRAYDIGWRATTLPLMIVMFQGIYTLTFLLIQVNLFFGQFLSSDVLGFLGLFAWILWKIGGLMALILGLILLFYPGKKGDNEFWQDPINTKVSFFG